MGVVADPVGHLRRGNLGAVDQGRRELDAVRRGRAGPRRARPERAPRPKRDRRCSWCSAPSARRPRNLNAAASGPPVGARLHRVPPRNPRLGSVPAELQRVDLSAEVTPLALQILVEVAVDHHPGMHHESADRRGPTSSPARQRAPG